MWLDGFSGAVLREHTVTGMVLTPAVASSGHLIAFEHDVDKQLGRVHAFKLARGTRAWSKVLPMPHPVVSAARAPDGAIVVLHANGVVRTLDPRDGAETSRVQIALGSGKTTRPMHGTTIVVDATRVMFVPSVRKDGPALLAFDRSSGGIAWVHELASPQTPAPHRCYLSRRDKDISVGYVVRERNGFVLRLHVVDADRGRLHQRIEIDGLSRRGTTPWLVIRGRAVVFVGSLGAVAWAADGQAEQPKVPANR